MLSIVNKQCILTKYMHNLIFKRKTQTLSSWNNIIKEAEMTVGYSTSFLNLRWLLTDEIASLASQLKKLIGSNHPIIETGKHLLTREYQPSWGLVVLLVAKASGVNVRIAESERDFIAGILHTQRMIAEVTEIFRSGIFFHKCLQVRREINESPLDMQYGNKIALLVGDYLITKSYEILAGIKNSKVEEIMCSAIRDITEANFLGERSEDNEPIPSPVYSMDSNFPPSIDQFRTEPYDPKEHMGKPKAEWALRNTLGDASLLGKGCMCAVELGGHPESLQKNGFSLGVNLALTNQAKKDLISFSLCSSEKLNRVSAPVLFHLQHNPSFNIQNLHDQHLRLEIAAGPGIQQTEKLIEELRERTLVCLNNFPDNEAKMKLHEIITRI